jgi:hypothetical protein
VRAWLLAFLFTQAVEVPVYVVALRGKRPWVRVAVAFTASALTHPVVWLFVSAVGRARYVPAVVAAELFAVSTEALWIQAFGVRRALLWSALANVLSLGLGVAARTLFGVP